MFVSIKRATQCIGVPVALASTAAEVSSNTNDAAVRQSDDQQYGQTVIKAVGTPAAGGAPLKAEAAKGKPEESQSLPQSAPISTSVDLSKGFLQAMPSIPVAGTANSHLGNLSDCQTAFTAACQKSQLARSQTARMDVNAIPSTQAFRTPAVLGGTAAASTVAAGPAKVQKATSALPRQHCPVGSPAMYSQEPSVLFNAAAAAAAVEAAIRAAATSSAATSAAALPKTSNTAGCPLQAAENPTTVSCRANLSTQSPQPPGDINAAALSAPGSVNLPSNKASV